MPPIYWLILGVILLIGEIFTMDFSLTCIGLAAFIAAGAGWAGLNVYWQLTIFAAALIIMLFTLRPFALKHLIKSGAHFKSNMDALIGRAVIITEVFPDDNKKGKAKIDGDEWVLHSETPLVKEQEAVIVKVDGATLIVKK